MAEVAVFDIDGTLVDSNDQHALAWFRAFRDHGIVLPAAGEAQVFDSPADVLDHLDDTALARR
jgi:beta-phosphoglucomutase-like phosphatase (HAD superfamily)